MGAFFSCSSSNDEEIDEVENALSGFLDEEGELDYLSKISLLTKPELRKLLEIFNKVSQSHIKDGKIDADEFAEAIGISSKNFLAHRFFHEFNKTQTKAMNFREFVLATSVLSKKASLEDKIRFSFDLYDMNHDNNIDLDELRTMLESTLTDQDNTIDLTPELKKAVLVQTFSDCDFDGNGQIDFEEYSKLCIKCPRMLLPFSIDFDFLESNQEIREVSESDLHSKQLKNYKIKGKLKDPSSFGMAFDNEIRPVKSIRELELE